MNTLKNVATFMVLAFLPVAVLLANSAPQAELATKEEVQIRRSVAQWDGMKKDMHSILKRADKLSAYQANME